jgi:hypothetical protein
VALPSEGAWCNTSSQQNQEGEYQKASNVQGNILNQSTNATEKRVRFGASELIGADTSVSAAVPLSSPGAKDLQMPQMINLAESSLRRSSCLQQLRDKKSQEERHPSVSATTSFKNRGVKAVTFALFAVIATVCSSAHSRIIPLPPTASRYER